MPRHSEPQVGGPFVSDLIQITRHTHGRPPCGCEHYGCTHYPRPFGQPMNLSAAPSYTLVHFAPATDWPTPPTTDQVRAIGNVLRRAFPDDGAELFLEQDYRKLTDLGFEIESEFQNVQAVQILSANPDDQLQAWESLRESLESMNPGMPIAFFMDPWNATITPAPAGTVIHRRGEQESSGFTLVIARYPLSLLQERSG